MYDKSWKTMVVSSAKSRLACSRVNAMPCNTCMHMEVGNITSASQSALSLESRHEVCRLGRGGGRPTVHMGDRQPTLTLRGIVETAEKDAERAWRCLGLWIFTCGLFFRTRCLGGVVANRCRRASTLAWCAQGAKPLDFTCLTGGSSQHSKYHSHFLRQPAAFLRPPTSLHLKANLRPKFRLVRMPPS
jgi:hypothetical protein